MQPLITVIIPVYKVEKYLRKCIESVLSQTYTNLEIFLVDDGSPDKCGEICDEYAVKDSRIKVIHKENGGLSSARNAALDVMTGQYLVFVDSDDWIPDDSLQTMYDALIRSGADMAIGNIISVTESGETYVQYCPSEIEMVESGKEIFNTMNQPCASNRLYKAKLYENIRFPDGKLYEDAFVYHHILEKVNTLVFSGKPNYYYLKRNSSIMRSPYTSKNMDVLEAVVDQADTLDRNGLHEIAMEKRMFLYSQLAVSYAFLNKADSAGIRRRNEFAEIYKQAYPELMSYQKGNIKQQIRLFSLRYFPKIHTLLWGKKMPFGLG